MQNTKHSQMCPNWGTLPYQLLLFEFTASKYLRLSSREQWTFLGVDHTYCVSARIVLDLQVNTLHTKPFKVTWLWQGDNFQT